MKAMILAAGRGQRMMPLTADTPKPLLKVGEHRLIEHLLYALAHSKFTDIVINISYLSDQFKTLLGDGKRYGARITYSVEHETEGLETGGGIFNALHLLGDDPFLVVSGDIWTDFPFETLRHPPTGLAHFVLVPNPSFHPAGDFSLDTDGVVGTTGEKLTFANIGIYHPALFSECTPGKFPMREVWQSALQSRKITGETYHGEWGNIGTPADLLKLTESYQ